jgi:hypothetical protein
MKSSHDRTAAAAAMLVAASTGCFAFGVLYLLGDKSKVINKLLGLYPPSGALSGVLILGTLAWLICWGVLSLRWRSRPPAISFAVNVAIWLLIASLLLTFPPLVRLI